MRIWLAVRGRAELRIRPDPRVLLTLEIIAVYEWTQPGWWWDAGKLVMRQEVREGFIYTGFFLC